MMKTKTGGIIIAIACAFVASSMWYSPILFGRQFLRLSGMAVASKPSLTVVASEMLRNLILASAIGWILSRQRPAKFSSVLALAAVLFLGFPVVLLSGSVIWQRVPPELALLHAGDWLIKILVMSTIPWTMSRNADAPSTSSRQEQTADHAFRPN